PLSAQQLVNFYAEQAPRDAKSPVALFGTPGIKAFCDGIGDGPIRGMELMNGILYVLSGDVLYSVTSDCVKTILGDIGGDEGGSGVTLPTEDALDAGYDLTGLACPAPIKTVVTAQVTLNSALAFNGDGTIMYVGDRSSSDPNKTIYQYDLDEAYEVDTRVYSGKSFTVGAESGSGSIDSITFNPDRTKLYIIWSSSLAPTARQYTLGTAEDISTCTLDASPLLHTFSTGLGSLRWNGNGTKYYWLSTVGAQVVEEWSIGPGQLPYDLDDSKAILLDSFNFGNESTLLEDFYITPDETKLFTLDNFDFEVLSYTFATPGEVGTLNYDGEDTRFEYNLCTLNATSLEFSPTGHRMYIGATSGGPGDVVFQWPLTPPESASSSIVNPPEIIEMPAIVETPGGGGVPLKSPDCVSMSHNDAATPELVIVDGTNGWIYDTTNGLRQITDEDFFSADVVDFQDQYFVFNRAGTGQFFLSNLNAGSVYTATDIATAEGDPDRLVALISNRRELWLFGAETIEIWYNSGNADFPFSRFEGGFLERGCAAAFSIAEDDNSIFWLAEDRIFYRAEGYTPQRISQHGIEEALRKYKVVSDACAFIYTMGGHKFYVCTFAAEDATWVYDITTGLWHERRSDGMGRWRVSVYADAFGKHLVGDFEDGR
ncbi:hypothetical protein LCGC14_2143130, partial [marine sediment metagenome]